MVYGLVLVVHILIALFLIGVILLQGGRGGMGETLGGAGAQSLFGGGANIVMAKVTAVGAAMFMVTCLSLAALSTARGQSVIEQLPMTPEELPLTLPPTEADTPPPGGVAEGSAEERSSRPATDATEPTAEAPALEAPAAAKAPALPAVTEPAPASPTPAAPDTATTAP